MTIVPNRAGKSESETVHESLPLRDATVSGSSSVKFPRTARLLKNADFRHVYEQGRRQFSVNFTVFYLGQPSALESRIGFTVSRALGGAVDRNRMKRRLREASRAVWHGFHPAAAVDVVVNPKKSLLSADFAGLVEEMRKALAVVERNATQNARPAQNVSQVRSSRVRKGKP
jgi:ribonuclease P protein component